MAGRGDVEIIGLRADRGCLGTDRLLHRHLATLQERRVGTCADDLAGGCEMRREIRDDGRIGLDRPLFVRNVFAVGIACVPAVIGEQPDIYAERVEHVEAALRYWGRNQMLPDRPELVVNDRAAVEGADGKCDRKRLDQKTHADGRPAGDDGEADAGLVQPAHGCLCAIGQYFVLRQQGAVDVGNNKRNAGHWVTRFN